MLDDFLTCRKNIMNQSEGVYRPYLSFETLQEDEIYLTIISKFFYVITIELFCGVYSTS